MSRATREINRITTTIIGISARLLIAALVFLLMYEGITRGYQFGHDIFSPAAVDEAPGVSHEVVIEEGESLTELAGRLEEAGLIPNRYIMMVQAKIYDYEIYPGTYTLNTSTTSRDMLKLIDETGAAAAKEAAGNGADSK